MNFNKNKTEKLCGNFNKGIQKHWDEYYGGDQAPSGPSTFAHFCKENFIDDGKHIFEIGCGNGRDTFYFAATNNLTSIDASHVVIEKNTTFAKKSNFKNINFVSGFFGENQIVPSKSVDYFYSRFVLHAMDENFEGAVIQHASAMLRPGGLFLAEFRTLKDPLRNKGKNVGLNERVTDHYRRFIDAESVISKLKKNGFEIVYSVESSGLAVHKNDDPVVARIVAKLN